MFFSRNILHKDSELKMFEVRGKTYRIYRGEKIKKNGENLLIQWKEDKKLTNFPALLAKSPYHAFKLVSPNMRSYIDFSNDQGKSTEFFIRRVADQKVRCKISQEILNLKSTNLGSTRD